jgi:uncharacterized protein with PIN domain
MKQATFIFYSSLTDFLASDRENEPILVSFQGRQSVKHLIESLHVPHTDVGKIIVKGDAVDFSYIVEDGDFVQVHPAENGNPIKQSEESRISPEKPQFVLDNHLGRLARYLRMLGFDVLYQNDYQDSELANIAENGDRILLTRDRGLLMRKAIKYGYCIRNKDPKKQVAEVVERFDLKGDFELFQRCLVCNHPLEPVAKEDIIERLQPLTKKYYEDFRICPHCDRVYWKGSHYLHMESFLRSVIGLHGSEDLMVR